MPGLIPPARSGTPPKGARRKSTKPGFQPFRKVWTADVMAVRQRRSAQSGTEALVPQVKVASAGQSNVQTSIFIYDAWHEKFKCYNLRMNKIVKVMRRTMFCTLLHRKCRDCWERQRKRKTEPPSNCPVKSFLSSRRRVNCVKGSLSGLRFFYAQSIRVEPRLTSSL